METGEEDPKFLDWYRDVEKHDKDSQKLRIFDHKEYFTVHGKHAITIAEEFFRTRDVVRMLGKGKNQIESICIRPGKLPRILKALLEKKQSIDLYTLEEKRNEWVITKKSVDGNTADFEDILFGGDDPGLSASTAVMAVKLATNSKGSRVLGLAWADVSSRVLEVCEFEEGDRFANFESVVVQHGSKECLLGYDKAPPAGDIRKITEILERCNVVLSERKAAAFKIGDISQDLKVLIGSVERHSSLLEKKYAISSLSCLIKELELLQDESGFGKWKLKAFDLSQYMKLDQAAMYALNLFPTEGEADKHMTLYGILNKGKTAMGSRLLAQWIKQPLLDRDQINRRLNYVELFATNTTLRQSLQEEHLKGIPDIDRFLKRLQSGKANLQIVIGLYTWMLRLPALVAALKEYEGPYQDTLKAEFIDRLEQIMGDLSQFEAMVEQTVDLSALDRHEYLINPAFNRQLEDLSKVKKKIQKDMQTYLDEVAEDLELEAKNVKLNFVANLGHHFRVSRKNEKNLRQKRIYKTLETRKDGVRFTTSKMQGMSKKLIDLTALYDEAQKEIVSKAVEIAGSYAPVLEESAALLSELDVLVSWAHVAVSAPAAYTRPVLHPMGTDDLLMENARHPCMELMDSVSFISNDLRLTRGRSNVQVITGPNMGGKSTYIRMAGVIALMAQIGSFVPCDRAELPIVDCILARVGAGDSQLKGVSTFMKEMLEASAILQEATKNSLVVIDELGRGTSTYDGFGLAWAIAEHIAQNIQCFALFATHFHELTALALTEPSVVNKHVTALPTNGSITMLYKVKDGPCDRSFGIHVSELAHFPSIVVEMAKRKAEELEDFGSQTDLLARVEAKHPDKRKKITVQDLSDKDSSITHTKASFLSDFANLPLNLFKPIKEGEEQDEQLNENTLRHIYTLLDKYGFPISEPGKQSA